MSDDIRQGFIAELAYDFKTRPGRRVVKVHEATVKVTTSQVKVVEGRLSHRKVYVRGTVLFSAQEAVDRLALQIQRKAEHAEMDARKYRDELAVITSWIPDTQEPPRP